MNEKYNPSNLQGSLPKDEELRFNIEALYGQFGSIQDEIAGRAVANVINVNSEKVEE